MSVYIVLAIAALVVVLLYAFDRWIPIDAQIKKGVGFVVVSCLLLWVIFLALRARGIV